MKLSQSCSLWCCLFSLRTWRSRRSRGTGTMGFQLGTYGRIRLDVPVYPGTRQLDRMSFVVALSPTAVFDYTEDSENLEPPSLTTGGIADTTATVLTDNSFSNLEPNVRVRVTVYSWHNDGFVIAKYTIINTHTGAYTLPWGRSLFPNRATPTVGRRCPTTRRRRCRTSSEPDRTHTSA